ncbi:MAG: NADH-quinone oxidoreductase subunit J [Candidatus Omnitrophica bacterium]|nr:NADH-quinone oxidoreductase subunit J [Candidatus Omnitrophota bacterium]
MAPYNDLDSLSVNPVEHSLIPLLQLGAKIGFYLLAGITLFGALGVVLTRNLFHSALCLAAALIGIAGVYLYLGAEFLAVVQVLVYVGAILTLLIFGIMLTAKIGDPSIPQLNRITGVAALLCAAFALALFLAVKHSQVLTYSFSRIVPLAALGQGLVTTYILPFEILSLILVGALVGAIVIARREGPGE